MHNKIIEKFKQKHGELYDYSEVVYINSRTKVKIICKEHGIFEQEPASHTRGRGCGKCSNNVRLTTENFIIKARKVHSNRYIYDNVIYINSGTKIQIKCRIHGDFEQSPNSHLDGRGCPSCAIIYSSRKRSLTSLEFIKKAASLHKGKYNYEKTVYKTSNKDKVIITCPTHGDFKQAAADHLAGKGCSKCQLHGFDKNKPGILYYLSINNGQAYKIGITNNTVKKRFSKDELKIIEVLNIEKFENGNEAYLKEQEFLAKYKKYKYVGPNLLKAGNTELFSTNVLKI